LRNFSRIQTDDSCKKKRGTVNINRYLVDGKKFKQK